VVVIVGAGLAGLSTAFHLRGLPYHIVEKEPTVGGLCRSYRKDGFTFDFTGHLLHFRQPAIRALVEGLLAGQLAQHRRKSFIYSHATYTEYPFQVNTFGLPPEVVRDCLMGFMETLTAPRVSDAAASELSFRDWILSNLGEGMAKHFMVPFNEKLWQVPLSELTSDWVSWLVPKPQLRDVVNGALGIKDKDFGYNPTFLYPAQGGIEALPNSFLPGVSALDCHTELVEVDVLKKRAVFARLGPDGQSTLFETDYEALVSTIPIPELVRRCHGLSTSIKEAASRLRYVSVYNVNLAVERADISDKHWIYFPEKTYPFYRAGFPMNFSPALGRPGCSSLYVEMSHRPEVQVSDEVLVGEVRLGLERAGILRGDDRLAVADVKNIHYAYVLFDRQRAVAVPAILGELERHGIHSIGRYGRWEHTSMEDAMAQGKVLAERLSQENALPLVGTGASRDRS
jgi:protoporphyrinogen oxidase